MKPQPPKQSGNSREVELITALNSLSMARRAAIGSAELGYFASKLSHFPFDDVCEVCATFATRKREVGEPAFPLLGDFIGELAKLSRKDRAKSQALETLTVWRCVDCGVTCSGWTHPHDERERRCQGIPRTKRTDGQRICGGLLEIVMRESEPQPREAA